LTPEQLINLGRRWGIDPTVHPCFSVDDPILLRLLGDVSVKTVRRKIESGELPAVEVSERRTVIMTGDLIEFLAERRTGQPVVVPVPEAAKPKGRPRKRVLLPRARDFVAAAMDAVAPDTAMATANSAS
jgi:hypothetical protein